MIFDHIVQFGCCMTVGHTRGLEEYMGIWIHGQVAAGTIQSTKCQDSDVGKFHDELLVQ